MLEYSLKTRITNNEVSIDLQSEDRIDSKGYKPPIFKILKHSSRAHREVRATDPTEIERSLRSLAVFADFMLSSGLEWYMTGGIALDLVKCRAYRIHGDLDVVLPISEAPKLAAFLKSKRVATYRRVCTATYIADNRLTLFRKCNPNLQDFGNLRTLKIFMNSGSRVLPAVDVHFVEQNHNGSRHLCDKKIVSLPFPLRGDKVFTVNGIAVRCCDLRVMLYMKSDGNPRNFYDARRISQEISKSDVEHVRKLKNEFNNGRISTFTPALEW